MSKFNSFITLKDALDQKMVSPYDAFLKELDKEMEERALLRQQEQKRFNALFDRVLSKIEYYGLPYDIEYSTRSESVYIKVNGSQIRISGHDVAPGNRRSHVQFLSYESHKSIAPKLITLKNRICNK